MALQQQWWINLGATWRIGLGGGFERLCKAVYPEFGPWPSPDQSGMMDIISRI